MPEHVITMDGNEAAASIACRLSDVIAIYPITPSTPMGEHADAWAAAGVPSLWGTLPEVVKLQSEAGVAGVLHGALQTGALATTFTASQGLLLMIPNMHKIAGELTPLVIHVAARARAAQGLLIFGDHSDVMAVRSTGFAMLAPQNVQAAQDLALVAHAATLSSRIPFVHVFDGVRTSHEINKLARLGDDALRAMIDDELAAGSGRAGSHGGADNFASDPACLLPPLGQALARHPHVAILAGGEVLAAHGAPALEALEVRADGQVHRVAVDRAFVDLGLVPNSEMAGELAELDKRGLIVVDRHNMTATTGLFAAGDVTSIGDEQVLAAIGDGTRAAKAPMAS